MGRIGGGGGVWKGNVWRKVMGKVKAVVVFAVKSDFMGLIPLVFDHLLLKVKLSKYRPRYAPRAPGG